MANISNNDNSNEDMGNQELCLLHTEVVKWICDTCKLAKFTNFDAGWLMQQFPPFTWLFFACRQGGYIAVRFRCLWIFGFFQCMCLSNILNIFEGLPPTSCQNKWAKWTKQPAVLLSFYPGLPNKYNAWSIASLSLIAIFVQFPWLKKLQQSALSKS